MFRINLPNLKAWLSEKHRKPLVIRGARQIGKTWIVRKLAKDVNKTLIELNFEKNKQFVSLFATNDTDTIIQNLESALSTDIDPNNSILFLDEIQVVPELLAKLRWFAEDMPQLAVIATGSMLDFILQEPDFSMPVGRISYMHLYPLSFEEFLIATGSEKLYDYLTSYKVGEPIPDLIHQKLSQNVREFLLVGGMPQAVLSWKETKSIKAVNRVQYDLIRTYKDDFMKYRSRIDKERLEEVFYSIPKMLGQKFKYSQVNKDVQSSTIKKALNLLEMARVGHKVKCCDATGLPFEATVKDKYFKMLMLDIGLASTELNLSLESWLIDQHFKLDNVGGIGEQFVGQALLSSQPYYEEPSLYYWAREEKGSSAEIDYLTQHHGKIIPIEVKAGSTGQLKSLHLIAAIRNFSHAIRINSDQPSITQVEVQTQIEQPAKYQLLSIPYYLTGQLRRLLSELIN